MKKEENDFEQLYYDAIYQINQLKKENEKLNEELKLISESSNTDNLKKIIVKNIVQYKQEKQLNIFDCMKE